MYCAKFYPKKKKIKQNKTKPKPKPNQVERTEQTRRNFIQVKKKKNRKDKLEKDKKLVVGWRRAILSNTHLSPFLSNFLPVLKKMNFGKPKKKIIELHHFSLPFLSQPNTLPTYFLSYFSFFFFYPS